VPEWNVDECLDQGFLTWVREPLRDPWMCLGDP